LLRKSHKIAAAAAGHRQWQIGVMLCLLLPDGLGLCGYSITPLHGFVRSFVSASSGAGSPPNSILRSSLTQNSVERGVFASYRGI